MDTLIMLFFPIFVLYFIIEICAPFVVFAIMAVMFIGYFIKTEFFPSENKELGPLV